MKSRWHSLVGRRWSCATGLAVVIALATVDVRAQGVEAAPPADDETVVSLPPLLVEERLTPLRWRYLDLPGLEVLSVCDDSVTRDFIRRCLRLEQVLQVLVPKQFQAQSSVAETQILFNEDLRRAKSQEVMTEMLGREKAPLPSATGTALAPWQRRRVSFLPNLRLADVDASAIFAATQNSSSAQLDFTFVVDRIAALLERRVPALPDWFVVGTVGLYTRTQLSPDGIVIDPAIWISEAETRALVTDENHPRTLWPMEELLTQRRPNRSAGAGERDQIWRAQCALFVRWALTEKDGAWRDGLWSLVDRLEQEPLSEALFRECLGLGFADVRDRLSDYLPVAVAQGVKLRAPKETELPPLKMREATDVEIARIRGDWERMQINYVKRRFPEVTEKYVDQARRTLLKAYEAGARDPQLLAVIGLTECDAGNPDGARAYLEAAARGGVARPRVYAELGRLRWEELKAGTGEERYDVHQVAQVLEPLLAARRLAPPLPSVYALMADVWSRSAEAPSPEDLAVLHEGGRLFPQFSAYLLRVIYLEATNGQIRPARELAEIGARHAPDPAMRERFERVLDELRASAPP